MFLLAPWLACTLPPAPSSDEDSAELDESTTTNRLDICYPVSLIGHASGTYKGGEVVQGGCGGDMTLWCDGGIRGFSELTCDGELSSLTLDLEGVQSGSELVGRVAISTSDGTEAVVADWQGEVSSDLTVDGGFGTSSGQRIGGDYELSGAFLVGFPPAI
jgi:hypothetical protein